MTLEVWFLLNMCFLICKMHIILVVQWVSTAVHFIASGFYSRKKARTSLGRCKSIERTLQNSSKVSLNSILEREQCSQIVNLKVIKYTHHFFPVYLFRSASFKIGLDVTIREGLSWLAVLSAGWHGCLFQINAQRSWAAYQAKIHSPISSLEIK